MSYRAYAPLAPTDLIYDNDHRARQSYIARPESESYQMHPRMSQAWTIDHSQEAPKTSQFNKQSWSEANSEYGRSEQNLPQTPLTAAAYLPQEGFSQTNHKSSPWVPSFWTRLPVTGIAALAGAVLLTGAAVAVLVLSDQKPTTSWGYNLKPTVYLSLATALTNILLTYALAEGVIISFWRNAKRGSTLRELHQYWLSGSSVVGALKGGLRASALIVGLACVMTTLSVARGPLFQNATTVQNALIKTQDQMTVHVAPKLPFQYTSIPQIYHKISYGDTPAYLSANFSNVMLQYQNHSDISITQSGCTDTCYATVKAFGFRPDCNKETVVYSYGIDGTEVQDPVTVFAANATITSSPNPDAGGDIQGYYNVVLFTTYIAEPDGSETGDLEQHSCTLQSGIVEYSIIIKNDSVSFQSNDWRDDHFVSELFLDAYPQEDPSETDYIIAGFASAASDLYASSVTMYDDGIDGIIAAFSGLQANQYLKSNADGTYPSYTNMSWNDPMDDMINAMREIALRTSIAAASNTSVAGSVQTVPFKGTTTQIVYVTNYHYTVIAAAVSLLGILTVIPTFWGWWDDGREISMSPLEIAKAFDAPLLAQTDGNATAKELIDQVGEKRVRYGELVQPGRNGTAYGLVGQKAKLAFCDSNSVIKPAKGELYS